MESMLWLSLGYQVPIQPSKNRVYIWRKLKEYGAVYYRQGVVLLPMTQSSLTKFMTLSAKIKAMGGESSLAELRFLDKEDEKKMIAQFQAQSQKEYMDLFHEVQKLHLDTMSGHNWVDAKKRLERRMKQVRSRDYFSSRRRAEVTENMEELLQDMSHAASDLSSWFSSLFLD